MSKDLDRKVLTIFDSPVNRRRVRWILFGVCLLLLVLDFFVPKHGEFYWKKAPNFFAGYGFISCVSLIFIAKLLRKILKRDEGYYD
ncbi:MAG: hypothetical protein QME78_03770 [Thermodesulfobacteriota bacterium]|nr:hypothetical protein [Thermodesulfobacteriota bacterium]